MLNVNNPAVNLETRTFLRGLVDDRSGLDEACVRLLERAVSRVKDISPSGWVYLLARELGAKTSDALEAASLAELYYAMCSFTDDVQDGEARYMEMSEPLLINTAAQLICATAVRADRFAWRLGLEGETGRSFLDGVSMLRGQRLEILREAWSIERYEEVARLSGGRQFDVYLRAAAAAAGVDPGPFLRLSDPLAILVQAMHDRQSGDERLTGLPPVQVEEMLARAKRRLFAVAEDLPEKMRPFLDELIGATEA